MERQSTKIRQGNEDFGVRDEKGRRLGAYVSIYHCWVCKDFEAQFGLADTRDRQYYQYWVQATRDGHRFGARQSAWHAPTLEMAETIVAKKLKGSKARALRLAAKAKSK